MEIPYFLVQSFQNWLLIFTLKYNDNFFAEKEGTCNTSSKFLCELQTPTNY